jgi:hypothetical protein
MQSVFRNPADLLTHDHFHLKDLFAEYERLVPGEREKKTAVVRRIDEELRLHVRIEEQLLYPSLLSLKSRAVEELVRTARSEHKALLTASRNLMDASEELQDRLMKDLFKQIDLYAGFEEKRLLPWSRALPGVTLREMALEIEEMKGAGGTH